MSTKAGVWRLLSGTLAWGSRPPHHQAKVIIGLSTTYLLVRDRFAVGGDTGQFPLEEIQAFCSHVQNFRLWERWRHTLVRPSSYLLCGRQHTHPGPWGAPRTDPKLPIPTQLLLANAVGWTTEEEEEEGDHVGPDRPLPPKCGGYWS